MFLETAKQFLINAHMVPLIKNQTNKKPLQFEFIFNEQLELLQSLQLTTATSSNNYKIEPIKDLSQIYKILFELNHIRVNPILDNHKIILMLTNALNNIGVRINNQHSTDSLAICFQPLGEIRDSVRFYFKENNQIIFLSKNKPKLTVIKPNF